MDGLIKSIWLVEQVGMKMAQDPSALGGNFFISLEISHTMILHEDSLNNTTINFKG